MTTSHIPLNGDAVLNAVTTALQPRPSTAQVLSSALEGESTQPRSTEAKSTRAPATDPSQGRAPARRPKVQRDPILEAFMGLRSFR